MAAPMWHYSVAGQQFGPVSQEQLKHLIATGQLSPTDLVWRDGLPNWLPLHSVPELAPAPGFPPTPNYAPAPSLGYYYRNTPQYAGFWLRFAAFIIDWIVTTFAGCIVNLGFGFAAGAFGTSTNQDFSPVMGLAYLLNFALGWLYYALLESSSFQGTLGKMAIGIYVTDLQGQRISFARATGRYFGKILSSMILLIGFIMAAFTERKQALHDLLAGTLVLRR